MYIVYSLILNFLLVNQNVASWDFFDFSFSKPQPPRISIMDEIVSGRLKTFDAFRKFPAT